MNSFGRLFRVTVFGESHGPAVGVIIDGVPPGIPLMESHFKEDLGRRKGGRRGSTPRVEEDLPVIQSGVFNGFSTGTPLAISFPNNNIRPSDYEKQREIPRPGHADFVARVKYHGYEDYRGGGHFSARITTGVVAAGVIAKKILREHLGYHQLHISAHVSEIAGCRNIEEGLDKAIAAKDSVGGLIEGVVTGLPIGHGEPFWDSVESLLAHAFFAIPAVKGVEFGAGFDAAKMFGSEHNDAITDPSGKTETNHAGGIVGGTSNGNDIYFKLAVKPTSSTPKVQRSLNWESNKIESFSIKGRHDLCVALRAPVIVEAMTAIVLADLGLIHSTTNPEM